MSWSQDNYIKAYRFAATAHSGQILPNSNLPYLVHVSLVGMEVMTALTTDLTRDGNLALQCALLHDVVEDTSVTIDQLRSEFGDAVASGVSALTKDSSLPKERQIPDSLYRIQQQPPEIWMVKLADRITNLQPPPSHWTQQKIAHYREESIVIYQLLKNSSPLLAHRLLGKIDQYQQWIQSQSRSILKDNPID